MGIGDRIGRHAEGGDLEAPMPFDLDLALGDLAPKDVRHAVDRADAGARVADLGQAHADGLPARVVGSAAEQLREQPFGLGGEEIGGVRLPL